jgi:hypothetical protein
MPAPHGYLTTYRLTIYHIKEDLTASHQNLQLSPHKHITNITQSKVGQKIMKCDFTV